MGNLKAAALKMIKTFITPEQIKEITADLMKKAIDEKNKIYLDPLNNEADAVAIFYEIGGKIIFSIAILSPGNNIIRFENTQAVEDLIDKIIKDI